MKCVGAASTGAKIGFALGATRALSAPEQAGNGLSLVLGDAQR